MTWMIPADKPALITTPLIITLIFTNNKKEACKVGDFCCFLLLWARFLLWHAVVVLRRCSARANAYLCRLPSL
jgi:hypothetical protein